MLVDKKFHDLFPPRSVIYTVPMGTYSRPSQNFGHTVLKILIVRDGIIIDVTHIVTELPTVTMCNRKAWYGLVDMGTTQNAGYQFVHELSFDLYGAHDVLKHVSL